MTTTTPAIDSTTGRGPVPDRSEVSDRGLGAWMRSNLTTQGYCLTTRERRELSLALRFSTGTCLLLVATALALESPAMIFALSGVGLIAGLTARHPFDLVWNHGIRRLTGRPSAAAQPNPASPRVQDRDGLAAAPRRPAHGRRDDRCAGSRRAAARGVWHRDRHQPLPTVRDVRVVGSPHQSKRSRGHLARSGHGATRGGPISSAQSRDHPKD